MCPNPIVFGLTLYDLLICVGIITCFFVFNHLADKAGLRVKLQKFTLLVGVCAISLGFGSAILFQALYNIEDRGGFELTTDTGATFYGGLVGGIVTFILLYFALGRIFFRGELAGYHGRSFFTVAGIAAPTIAVAHAFGRLGCLMAGCCHGAPTDSFIGIMMHGDMGYQKYVPVQLFESIVLFALFALLFYRARKGERYNFSLYVLTYGVWRFLIEYARADYRGSVPVLGLTPSQLTAVLMAFAAVGLFLIEKTVLDRMERAEKETPSADVAQTVDAGKTEAPDEETEIEGNGDGTDE